MLKDLRLRLLREMPWKSADDLAQEIFAALSDETTPQEIPEGIRLTSRNGVSPIQITDFGDDDEVPLMQFTRGSETYEFAFNGGQLRFGLAGETEPIGSGRTASSSSGNVFPGKVVAYLGSNRYTMTIYPNGRAAVGSNVTVAQLQGDPAYEHDADSWALVCRESDGTYSMVIPVWGV